MSRGENVSLKLGREIRDGKRDLGLTYTKMAALVLGWKSLGVGESREKNEIVDVFLGTPIFKETSDRTAP